MEPEAHKVFTTHDHTIPGWTILCRIIHSQVPNIGCMNGDIQSDTPILALNQGGKTEYFYIVILKLQQEINLYGETVSPTRLNLHYMKAF